MCCRKRKESARRNGTSACGKVNSTVISSKSVASQVGDDNSSQQQPVIPDPLRSSGNLMLKSRVKDERTKSLRTETGEEDEKDEYDNVSLPEEISIDDLVDDWIDEMLSKGVKGLNDEFIALCAKTRPSPNNYTVFTANQHSGRNRYRNVVCLDHSRVKLNNHPTRNDYIHANYVSTPFSERRFICTQAPLDCTTFDFWFMIIQEKVRYIIMLTNFTEKGYTKSTLYFPFEANKTENYNGITVKCITCQRRRDFECEVWERSLVIEWPGVQSMLVTHLHWIDWPDHGIPNSYACPLLLLKMVRISSTPIVLHCSAGIGRTGCLVLIELVLEKLLCKQICSDMSLMLIELRRQRANLVQNNIQYLYVHRTLLHFFELVRRITKMDEVREFINEYDQFVLADTSMSKNLLHCSLQQKAKSRHVKVNDN